LLTGFLPAAHAQAPASNLNLFRNYFVTGDYSAGGVGLRGKGANGVAKGKIDIAGIPAGSRIIAAWLYWETAGVGADGKFHGKAIKGTALGTVKSPCFVLPNLPDVIVYRADVLQFLDTNFPGDYIGGGRHEVELPDSGNANTAPSTMGATLVIVWAHTSREYKSIVLFDGAYTLRPGTVRFAATLRGFDDAPLFANISMTHVVGGGRSDRKSNLSFEGRALGSTPDKVFTGALGGQWDTLTFKGADLRLGDGASTARTNSDGTAFPGTIMNCLTWAAVIMSTSVRDTDKDGLLDVWERQGYKDAIDGTAVDLPAMGADPALRNVYVEIDWMDKGAGETRDHAPKQPGLDLIVASFAAQNIRLRFDTGQGGAFAEGGNVIAHQASTEFKKDYIDIKRNNFKFNRRFIYHYCLMAHAVKFRDLRGVEGILPASGVADFPGGDFMLMMGIIPHTGVNAADTMVGTLEEQAGTIMHELGHNLNLEHGGDSSWPNYKPQHQSVMNYLYQMRGLFDANGKFVVDYSTRDQGALDENALKEADGSGNAKYRTQYFAPPNVLDTFIDRLFGSRINTRRCGPLLPFVLQTTPGAGAGAIDWNNSLAIDANAVAVDIGGTSLPDGACALETYKGHNDWGAVNLQQTGSRTPYSQALGSPADPQSQDIDFESYRDLAPPSVTALGASPQTTGVLLTWKSVDTSLVTHYRIYRITGPVISDSSVAYLGQVAKPLTSFFDSTTSSGGGYRFFVTSVDEYERESNPSDLIQVVMP
jgi:hypothetical protein